MTSVDRNLRAGDLIRTNPQDEYWGLAVVLDVFQNDGCAFERVHIGITPIVKKHKFTLDEIDPNEIVILQFEKHYSPTRDVTLKKEEPSIAKYRNATVSAIDVIGTIDISLVYVGPLSKSAGSGPGEFPLNRQIDTHLGNEAVVSWRRVYDDEAWGALVERSNARYFEIEEERLRVAREKVRERRDKKAK